MPRSDPATLRSDGKRAGSLYVVVSEGVFSRYSGLQLAIKKCTGLAFKIAKSIDADLLLSGEVCGFVVRVKEFLLERKEVEEKIAAVKKGYKLRFLFALVDTLDHEPAILLLNSLAFRRNVTLLLAWTWDDLVRYFKAFKVFENKPPDVLQGKLSDDFNTRIEECLTALRSVQKRDVTTLLANFGSFANLAQASMQELILCPGLGVTKVQRIYNAFHLPFHPPEASLASTTTTECTLEPAMAPIDSTLKR